jgi:hypothetical protein
VVAGCCGVHETIVVVAVAVVVDVVEGGAWAGLGRGFWTLDYIDTYTEYPST